MPRSPVRPVRLSARTFLLFSLVFLFIAGFSLFTYLSSLQAYEDRIEDVTLERINRTLETLDELRFDVERLANHIEVDPELQRALQSPPLLGSAAIASALNFTREARLVPYSLTSAYIDRYYVIALDLAAVFAPSTVHFLDTFLRYVVQFPPASIPATDYSMYERTWERIFLPETRVFVEGRETAVVPFFSSLGRDGPVLLVLVSARHLREDLRSILMLDDGYVSIRGPFDQTILTYGNQALAADAAEVRRYESSSNPPYWTVEVRYEEALLAASFQQYGNRHILTVVSFLLLGTLLTAFAAYQSYKPISQALSELYQSSLSGSDVLAPGEHAPRDLLTAGIRVLKDLAEQYREKAQEHILLELLQGSFNTDGNESVAVQTIEAELAPYPVHALAIELLSSPSEPYSPQTVVLAKARLKDEIQRRFQTSVDVISVDELVLATLVSHSDEVADRGADLAAWAQNTLGIPVRVTVGRPVQGIRDIRLSYLDTRRLLYTSGWENSNLMVWEQPHPQQGNWPDAIFTSKDEQALLSAVRNGDPDAVSELLDSAHDIVEQPGAPAWVREVFVSGLSVTVGRAWLEHRVEHTRQNFFQSGSLSDRVMLCRSELERLAREIARNRSRYQHDFYEDVRASIARHVFDPEISLQMIADEVEKSEYHLSRIMPQVIGENFKSYIDRTRMEHARLRLLEAPDEPVKSIMYECGYRQFNTFDRAFRRLYGVSPSEFRRQNRQKTP